jgi:hypothetical protein
MECLYAPTWLITMPVAAGATAHAVHDVAELPVQVAHTLLQSPH